MSRQQRLGFALVAVVIAVVAIVILASSGGDDEDTTTTTTGTTAAATATATTGEEASPQETATEEATPEATAINVTGGEVEGGTQQIEANKGDTVSFSVTSDKADEVHVHGYDLKKDVPAGGTVTFTFKADIVGIFEVELEDAGVQLASLRINQ